ncbi:oxidoreductase [Cladophialophora psammophila CBS 110553]|uniref:Oxidoreductase n=1 Tax=Cladophialophora psammophila CBS 110553 TaxID=1182543 RepID=W9WWC5_9EURO|nr:oxidoreductase [Cladophialophora psammophila CBS 110553]EXJ72507.1 oxidoreductase [Cladophialophora psammophila CBS 110553]
MEPLTETPPRYASDIVDPNPLAQSLQFVFSGRTAPNRFMKAAMTEQLASWHKEDREKRGIPTKNLIRVYERWARGGIGLILTGNFMIFLDHLESVGDPIIPPEAPFHGKRFEAFKELAAAGKAHGSLMVPQVSHPGRLCNNYFQQFPVAASAIPVDMTGEKKPLHFNPPHEASQSEIDAIVDSFAHAAEYLEKAGYDGIEIHGAHGFFLSGFISLATNERTDRYGGSIENRVRVILEVREAIRKRVSLSFIVGIKINSTEFQARDFPIDDARKLCAALEDAEFDFVELSGGTAENTITEHKGEEIRESTKRREAYFQEFAEKIIPGLSKTKVYITGGLRTVGGMVRALDVVDGVGLGRPLVQEFDLCNKILERNVTGSIVPKIGAGEFWLALMAGNRIIREVGQGKEPMKLWKDEVVAELRRNYDLWLNNKSSDREYISYYGFPSTEAMEKGLHLALRHAPALGNRPEGNFVALL